MLCFSFCSDSCACLEYESPLSWWHFLRSCTEVLTASHHTFLPVQFWGRLVVSFDCTYLTQTLCQMQLHEKRGLIGGTWYPDRQENAFIPLDGQDINVRTIAKSSTMLEFVGWDPSAKKRGALSFLAMPIEHRFAGAGSSIRSGVYMMNTIGRLMAESNDVIKCLVFDGHGSHQMIRKALHGQPTGLDPDDLAQLPFFGQLQIEDLWDHMLPRLPIKIVRYKGETVNGLPGICSLAFKSVSFGLYIPHSFKACSKTLELAQGMVFNSALAFCKDMTRATQFVEACGSFFNTALKTSQNSIF